MSTRIDLNCSPITPHQSGCLRSRPSGSFNDITSPSAQNARHHCAFRWSQRAMELDNQRYDSRDSVRGPPPGRHMRHDVAFLKCLLLARIARPAITYPRDLVPETGEPSRRQHLLQPHESKDHDPDHTLPGWF